MKVLVLGSGGREHAIAIAVKNSPLCSELICAPGNPGMQCLGRCLPVSVSDNQAILQLIESEKIDFTVVGPEIPLVNGLVDLLESKGHPAFGPKAQAAALEGSKAFSKHIMKKYGIPTAAYEQFTDLTSALDYLAKHPAPIVVKASGLAAGKGAVVCMTDAEAISAVEDMLGEKAIFGESGKTVVIEEFMTGEEVSLFAVCDGTDYVMLASAQDHKRIFDNDEGPNTGGMGAYAPAPIATADLVAQVEREVVVPTLAGMRAEGAPYQGVLYVGIMVTPEGPKVVEYNCRLGDPEAQVLLPVFGGDFLELCIAAAQGKIAQYKGSKETVGSAAIVVMASAGYPGNYPTGFEVKGIAEAEELGAQVLHAGTKVENGKLRTAGGRVFGVVGKGKSLPDALALAYKGVEYVQYEGRFFRKDIGQKGLARLKNA